MAYFAGLALVADRKAAPDLGAAEIHVALWVFARMWGDPKTEPGWKPLECSMSEAAEGCGLGSTSARRALHRLVALGYLNQRTEKTLNGKVWARSTWSPGPRAGGPGLVKLSGTACGEVPPFATRGGGTACGEEQQRREGKKGPNRIPPVTQQRRSPARLRATERRDGPRGVGESVAELIALWGPKGAP